MVRIKDRSTEKYTLRELIQSHVLLGVPGMVVVFRGKVIVTN